MSIWICKDFTVLYSDHEPDNSAVIVFGIMDTANKVHKLGEITLRNKGHISALDTLQEDKDFTWRTQPTLLNKLLDIKQLEVRANLSGVSLEKFIHHMYIQRFKDLDGIQAFRKAEKTIITRAIEEGVNVCHHAAIVRDCLLGSDYVTSVQNRAETMGADTMEKNMLLLKRPSYMKKIVSFDHRNISERLFCSMKGGHETSKNVKIDKPVTQLDLMMTLLEMATSLDMYRIQSTTIEYFRIFPSAYAEFKMRHKKGIFHGLVDYCLDNNCSEFQDFLKLPERGLWGNTAPIMLVSEFGKTRHYIITDPVSMHKQWAAASRERALTCWHEVFLRSRHFTNVLLDLDFYALEMSTETYDSIAISLLEVLRDVLCERYDLDTIALVDMGALYLYGRDSSTSKASLRVLWQMPLQLCAMRFTVDKIKVLLQDVIKHVLQSSRTCALKQKILRDNTGSVYFTNILNQNWVIPSQTATPLTFSEIESVVYTCVPQFTTETNLRRAVIKLHPSDVCIIDVAPYHCNKSIRLPLCNKPTGEVFSFIKKYNTHVSPSDNYLLDPTQSPVACLSCVPVESDRAFVSQITLDIIRKECVTETHQTPAIDRYLECTDEIITLVKKRLVATYQITEDQLIVNHYKLTVCDSSVLSCPVHDRIHTRIKIAFKPLSAEIVQVWCWKPSNIRVRLIWNTETQTYTVTKYDNSFRNI
uniref:Uncharacterized protein n=1 Tax=Ranid herpesvirus 4 TaxID=2849006 RepID=A0A8F3CIM1_9VIRU|nr:MAG: hypothetical protein [Ranid herpesvirus 4]